MKRYPPAQSSQVLLSDYESQLAISVIQVGGVALDNANPAVHPVQLVPSSALQFAVIISQVPGVPAVKRYPPSQSVQVLASV